MAMKRAIKTLRFSGLLLTQAFLYPAPGAYEGCFEETVRRRHFSISPGDYSPEITTTMTCRTACGAFDYKYAALAQ
ncbi:hypothetical protein RRG08_019329, partial [Elysia crispata]